MNKSILAICDREAEYVYRFQEYLNGKPAFTFQVQVFTETEQLYQYGNHNKIDILMIGESIYQQDMQQMNVNHIVLLVEHEETVADIFCIQKYQSSEKIIRELLYYYGRLNRNAEGMTNKGAGLIGIYTPIGRCLQTSFALLLGQLLAKKKKILYLNFESFSGFGRFMNREYTTDIIDMMYLMNNLQDRFLSKFQEIVQSINGMDYIPPAFSFMDLSMISKEGWLAFLEQIVKESGYDYIIMDLSDNVQGLFDILQKCQFIYTITREDGMAMAKIDQYEKLLRMTEHQHILQKTKHFKFPVFTNIPYEVDQLPFSELAKYVKIIIKEEFHEELSTT